MFVCKAIYLRENRIKLPEKYNKYYILIYTELYTNHPTFTETPYSKFDYKAWFNLSNHAGIKVRTI